MTRKDYIALARLLAANPEARVIINDLCTILKADNPRFDRAKFIEACQGNPTTPKEG